MAAESKDVLIALESRDAVPLLHSALRKETFSLCAPVSSRFGYRLPFPVGMWSYPDTCIPSAIRRSFPASHIV